VSFAPHEGTHFFLPVFLSVLFKTALKNINQNNNLYRLLDSLHHIEALKTGKKNPLTVWCCGFFLVL
jgi:hypothetical protein